MWFVRSSKSVFVLVVRYICGLRGILSITCVLVLVIIYVCEVCYALAVFVVCEFVKHKVCVCNDNNVCLRSIPSIRLYW